MSATGHPREAVHLGEQLPMLIHGLYYEGWHPGNKPLKERSKKAFAGQIEQAFTTDPLSDAESRWLIVWLTECNQTADDPWRNVFCEIATENGGLKPAGQRVSGLPAAPILVHVQPYWQ